MSSTEQLHARNRRFRHGLLEWDSMPWNKVIWWVILLVSGLMAYVAYLQLAPMD
jgi:hypothetical protein